MSDRGRSDSPTLRDELLEAQAAVHEATAALQTARERYRGVILEATNRGASLRELAAVLGITPQAIHQMIPKATGVLEQRR